MILPNICESNGKENEHGMDAEIKYWFIGIRVYSEVRSALWSLVSKRGVPEAHW